MTRPYTDDDPPPTRRPRRHQRISDPAKLDLFEQTVVAAPTRAIRGMVRGTDPVESQGAAVAVLTGCAALRHRILEILATEGPQHARALEDRREFARWGASTVRKRVSELHKAEQIVSVGRKDGCAVWDIAGGTHVAVLSPISPLQSNPFLAKGRR